MNDRKLTKIALCLSVVSLCYAAWLHQRTEYFAALALQKRETALVKHLTPKLMNPYRDMGVNENDWPKNPQTLEELFAPLLSVMDRMGDSSIPDAKGKAPPKTQ